MADTRFSNKLCNLDPALSQKEPNYILLGRQIHDKTSESWSVTIRTNGFRFVGIILERHSFPKLCKVDFEL